MEVRCYKDGRVEKHRKGVWVEVPIIKNAGEYNAVRVNGKKIYRHRLLAMIFMGLDIDDPTQTVDHINRNKLDNRVENLRIITQQQQCFNVGAKGYTLLPSGKWQSQIYVRGKSTYLGVFDTEEEASQAYLNSKNLYHII